MNAHMYERLHAIKLTSSNADTHEWLGAIELEWTQVCTHYYRTFARTHDFTNSHVYMHSYTIASTQTYTLAILHARF